MRRTLAIGLTLAVVVGGLAVPLGAVGAAAGQETAECAFPVTVTDKTGAEVTVEEEPDRIVALAPSAAQQLWAIDAQDRVVGMPVNQYTDYLEGREGVENVVGENGQPIQETVVGLEPDLVLAPNIIDNETVESLRGSDLTVYRYHEARSLEDVYDEIERTGLLVGEFETAASVSAEMRGTVSAIEDAVSAEDRPRVYYDLGGGWTAGPDTFVGDLIATAGGDNIAAEAGIDRYDPISTEVIADADPEVIVVHEGTEVPSNPAVDNSTAVREGTVVRVDANFLNQPGPRNAIPLREMAEAFHPETMADVDLEAVETPAPTRCAATDGGATPTEPGTETATDGVATDGDDGSGFTVVSAAVSVLAVALLARRRRR